MSNTTEFSNIFTTTESNQTILQSLIGLHKQDPRMKSYIDWVLLNHKPVLGRNPKNVIKWSDSYKYTQYNMTWDDEFVNGRKEKLIGMYAFVEPREGARDSHVIVAGAQALASELANIRVTIEDLYDTIVFMAAHFSTPVHDGRYHFNPFPWLKIIYGHDGVLPIKFSALAEGSIVPVGIPIATIESTDPDCAQIVSHLEPKILQKLWYSTTCATNALAYSKVIKQALKQTASDEVCNGWLPFALQDFALRGVTCMEAAETGCGSILYVTMGSDTVPAIDHVIRTMGNSNTGMPGFSVAAIEHNQAMMQGRAGEFKQVNRVLRAYPCGILSYVADTFDMRNFVDQVTSGELKNIIMERDGTFVIRPDSSLLDINGNELSPAETISEIFKIMKNNLGDLITVNSQGFRVLPPQYKIIYGDGLNISKIKEILDLSLIHI
jgi:nicotinamide phosphoribosyltransferase